MTGSKDPSRKRHDPAGDDATVIASSLTKPERFGALFDRHAPAIHRYLGRRVGPGDADDLLADVFVAAFRARDRYDTSRPNALPWLYGIASNVSARLFRDRTRAAAATSRLIGHDTAETDPQDLRLDRLDAESSWPTVARALESIADEPRETLLLYVWEGLSYEEIAVATKSPIGTVRSRISRARASLRELLEAGRENPDEERDD